MKPTLTLLVIAVSLLFVGACGSAPQPEIEVPSTTEADGYTGASAEPDGGDTAMAAPEPAGDAGTQ